MGQTIRGNTQITAGTITDTEINASAAIALSKLAEDVIQADGGQAFTANQDMGGNKLTGLGAPTSDNDAARKKYVDDLVTNMEWQDSALDYVTDNTGAPATEETGDRYVLSHDGGAPHADYDGASAGDIVQFNGSTWDATTPTTGMLISIDDETTSIRQWSGSAWSQKYFESTTASLGCEKSGMDIRLDLLASGGLKLTGNEVGVEPNDFASISAGLLETMAIDSPQEKVTVSAQYTEDQEMFEDEKEVLIFAICPSGSALEFDGEDDYVDCGNSFTFVTRDSSKTLMGWANSDIMNYPTSGRVITIYKEDGTSAFSILASGNPATWQGLYWIGGVVHGYLYSEIDVVCGQWTHIALVQEESRVSLYVNGVLADSALDAIIPSISSPPNASVGAFVYSGGLLHPFEGTLDEVRIYDRALSAEEIQSLTHNRPDTDAPNLVAYWDFDESEGQTAHDLSGNGNDGTLGSTPDVDNSDPDWIESDALVGICSPYLIAKRGMKRALALKEAALKALKAALAEEDISLAGLEELLESGDYVDLKKGDIVKAKQKIHSAMQHEEQAESDVDKSIDKLDDALNTLGIE